MENTTTLSDLNNNTKIEFVSDGKINSYRYFQIIDQNNILIDGKVMATPVPGIRCKKCVFSNNSELSQDHCFEIPCNPFDRSDGIFMTFVIAE